MLTRLLILAYSIQLVKTLSFDASTCNDLKSLYQDQNCCNNSTRTLSQVDTTTPYADLASGGTAKVAMLGKAQTLNFFSFLFAPDSWTTMALTDQLVRLYDRDPFINQPYGWLTSEADNTFTSTADGRFEKIVTLNQGVKWSTGRLVDADDLLFTQNLVDAMETKGVQLKSWGEAYTKDVAYTVEKLSPMQVKFVYNTTTVPGLTQWTYGRAGAPILEREYWGQFVNDSLTGDAFAQALFPSSIGINAPVILQRADGTFKVDADATDLDTGVVTMKLDRTLKAPPYSYQLCPETQSATYPNLDGTMQHLNGGCQTGGISIDNSGPFVDKFVMEYVENPLTISDAKKEEFLSLYSAAGAQELTGRTPVQEWTVQNNGYRYAAFNTRVFPTNIKEVRQAISCKLNKQEIIDTFMENVQSIDQHAVPAYAGAYASPISGILAECAGMTEEQRQAKAIDLLQSAGFNATDWGSNSSRNIIAPTDLTGPNGEVLTPFNLYGPDLNYDPNRYLFTLAMTTAFNEIGIPAIAFPTDFNKILEVVVFTPAKCTEWNAYILGWSFSSYPAHLHDNFFSAMTSCGGGFNTPGYNNSAFDALSLQFNSATSVPDTVRYFKEMNAILMEDMPYLPLFTTTNQQKLYGAKLPAYSNTVNVEGGYLSPSQSQFFASMVKLMK